MILVKDTYHGGKKQRIIGLPHMNRDDDEWNSPFESFLRQGPKGLDDLQALKASSCSMLAPPSNEQ